MKIAQAFKIFAVILMILCWQLPVLAQIDSSAPKNETILVDTISKVIIPPADTINPKNNVAKKDTVVRKGGIVGYLKRQKGMVGKLAKNLVGDTTAHSDLETVPIRNDLSFSDYENLTIRNIEIQRLDFGTLITDTTRNFKNSF